MLAISPRKAAVVRRALGGQKAGGVREQAFALNLVGLGAGDARGAAQGLTDESQRHVDRAWDCRGR